MSLFGGPLEPAPPDEDEVAYRSSPPFRSSPPVVPHTQPADSIERDLDTHDEASDEYSDSESDSEDERPNKFAGAASTWRKHTSKEREDAHSVAQMRANDLSLHLYNAHALKRRAQSEKAAAAAKPWHSKARWSKAEDGKAWIPPRAWTAWPLEPDQVPRAHERFAEMPEIDPNEEFTEREEGYEHQKPSRDMEDILVAVALRNAKERWQSREWEEETEDKGERKRSRSRRSSRAMNTVAGEIHLRESGAESSGEASTSHAATHTYSRPVILADDEKAHRILQPCVRSILSKLDDLLTALHRSRQNHFDDAHSKAGNETETAYETDAPQRNSKKRRRKNDSGISEGELQTKRRRGRPPKALLQGPTESTPDVTTATEAEDLATTPQKRKQGRPRKFPKPLPGESHYMMRKRIQQQQQQQQAAGISSNAPSRAPTAEPEAEGADNPSSPNNAAALPSAQPQPSKRPKPRRGCRASVSSNATTSEATSSDSDDDAGDDPRRGGDRAVGLRDWSEVLGTAALLGGFSGSIIERAARRCANLFGEGMTFRTLEEAAAVQAPAGELVQYVPETVPAPILFSSDEEEVEDEGDEKPEWDGVNLACPHVDCVRYVEPYVNRWRLREHVKRKHGYELKGGRRSHSRMGRNRRHRTDEEEEDDDDETTGETTDADVEMNEHETEEEHALVGAIHNDGFMEPILARPGWRGKDVEKSEKRLNDAKKRKRQGSGMRGL